MGNLFVILNDPTFISFLSTLKKFYQRFVRKQLPRFSD